MRYEPRSATGIPTEPVGSLPRPQALLDAHAGFAAGRLDAAALEAAQDAAVRDTIAHYEATGAPLISDGEQRRASFAAYPVVGSPATPPGADDARSSVFLDAHGRRLPGLAAGPFRYRSYAGDALAAAIACTSVPMKQPVVSPSTLALLYPLHGQLPGYSTAAFEQDLVEECEKDIRSAFAAGAARVSIDYGDGRLTAGDDPRHPWSGDGLAAHGMDLINRVMERFSARERMHLGVHTCAPPDHGTGRTVGPSYADLVPDVLRIDAGYFLLQLAGEPDRESVCAAIGTHLRSDANGVAQMAYVGVVDTRSPRVESAREVADTLVRAAAHIPPEQLGSTDDCGFSPFSDDPRPLAGLPDLARGIAFRKIRSRIEGTVLAAERLGIA